MNAAETAWLAGIIEGEGTIVWHAVNSVAINVFMTDEDVLQRCHAVSGVGTLRGPYTATRRPSQKPIWKWSVTRADDVVTFLTAIRPWMGQRRTARIDLALDRLANTRGRAVRLCDRGHMNWSGEVGHRHCRDCWNEAQRARRALTNA